MPTISGKIVVIDDDESIQQAMKSFISALGYFVDTFCSAKAFLESNMVQATSCLITDVQMRGMSGVELQQHLSDAGHRIPIIFVTGRPNEATRARVIRDGAIGYLSKPVGEHSLLACLNNALNLDH
ncbi:MAG: response regulator [Pseudolabrys sp.]